MPVAGDKQQIYSRSYVYLVPEVGAVGTWRLTDPDIPEDSGSGSPGGGGADLSQNGIVAADNGPIEANQFVYLDSGNRLRTAKADSVDTARVAGIALTDGNPGQSITYTRNQAVLFADVANRVDGSPSQIEPGRYYYLSAVTAGNCTRTPDTTTAGSVVVQVGIGSDTNEMTIEIQSPILI